MGYIFPSPDEDSKYFFLFLKNKPEIFSLIASLVLLVKVNFFFLLWKK